MRSAIVLCLTATILGFSGAAVAAEPRIAREDIEWCNLWIPQVNDASLPRVLLIGDSITQGYYDNVAALVKGKANVARLTTSSSLGDPALLGQVKMVLSQYKFDVIHFNNGLHGFGYTEQEYAKAFPELLSLFKHYAKGSKLVWATTTPMADAQKPGQFSPQTERVQARNRIAAKLVAEANIPVDDLFSLTFKHHEYICPDHVHHTEQGKAAQAAQVSKCLLEQFSK
jgi:lysophospholipase L1-like esterase